ncbi:MAG: class I SAM-dependent methyltransferase [Chitinophagales bacterium]|nr:class I SAM-dependent methyltransferase [Chitinophagaceae bacterium]MCB9064022.1 class I SAM-dependent methyltransferase [Chitinophagales bacterium]
MTKETSEYYNEVGEYFDLFAEKHHGKSDNNPILTGMRNSFREYVNHSSPKAILDIGCGPGMDVAFFAEKYPYAEVMGIDVSAKMLESAQALCADKKLTNTKFVNTGIEKLHEHVAADMKFDIIYVFFGALNTVTSLEAAAKIIEERLNPGGTTVLTFVNKYYLSEFFINILKLRPGRAMARWGSIWRGYSNDVSLGSKTYTPSDIQKAFAGTSLQLKKRRGYSIFFPAWFQQDWLKKYPKLCKALYKMDKGANNMFLWGNGEYTLFVYDKSA